MAQKTDMETVMAVDIGSTFTKGARFRIAGGDCEILGRESVPTTISDLSEGMGQVLRALSGSAADPEEVASRTPVFFSSSAKGGLGIIALGLTPELTVAAANATACSAGAKIMGTYSYKLTGSDISEITVSRPDIILFAGGTDGGNEAYIMHNAEMIAGSSYGGVIIYAGNRSARAAVASILSGKDAHFTDNIMPGLDIFEPGPARKLIGDIFLERIVQGKGLSRASILAGRSPKPTPLGIFELAGIIPSYDSSWSDFCIADPGGATTDFYSNISSPPGGEPAVDRGFEEPALKRTVEGDLGMRAGAMSLVESENSFIASELLRLRIPRGNFDGFVRRAASDNSFIGTGAEGESSDFILAEACLKGAASRHAGYMSEVFTPSGRVHVRRGKDLRPTRRVIGTGGYLSRHISGEICARSFEAIPDAKGAMPLFPDMERVELYRDASYVLPMLGAMASEYPEQAVGIALSNLEKIE